MNLRLIKNADNIENSVLLGRDKILIKEFEKCKYTSFNQVRYFVYDVISNEKSEILPDMYKLDIFRIVTILQQDENVYFIQYDHDEHTSSLVCYNHQTHTANILYTFFANLEEYHGNIRISFFVLNESNLLIQTEKLRRNLSDNYEGYFDFELTLYKTKEEKSYVVVDENLVNNGISDIVALTDHIYAIKTGYSLLEDDRYRILDKFEVSVESISVVNIKQLISDLVISQNGIVMDNIDQAYYKQTIPYIRVQDGYLIYSKVDNENKEEKVSFYNISDKTMVSCLNKGVVNEKKLAQHLIISQKPYIRIDKSKKTEFLNLKSKQVDVTIPGYKHVEDVVNDIFIISETKKGLLNKTKNYISVYKYPAMAILHSERGKYQGALYGDDTLYLFSN